MRQSLVPVYPLSVAPMMDRTDRHFRYFLRQISRHTLLYTEMVTVQALRHGDRSKLLDFSPEECPLALQLGGDDPALLAECAHLAEEWGYTEVNLNVGCPSDRVQQGHFGACLMAQPQRVADCVAAMKAATPLPITVKHRIGIDNQDSYEALANFVTVVDGAGCDRFSVHARKAWLTGLDPKQNRTIPPLRYGDVYRLKTDFPHLTIEINGGILTLAQAAEHLTQVDAVMIGRAAYDNPYLFAESDRRFYNSPLSPPSRTQVVEALYPYFDRCLSKGIRLHTLIRPLLQLFAGQPGSRLWKRHLTDYSSKPGAGIEVVEQALKQVQQIRSVPH
jgi:tRNA-dihydrouridine synthase A